MPPHRVRSLLLAALLLGAALTRAGAQAADTTAAGDGSDAPLCDGRTVTSIAIRPGRPTFEGAMSRWRQVARTLGFHHATTRTEVIESFLQLQVGQPCTDVRRAESERILRAQSFLADARVRTEPDDAGGVMVIVETEDESAALVSARFHGVRPDAFSLGNGNLDGEGILVEGRVERGAHYRTGIGGRFVDYATLGRPWVTTIDGMREVVGHHVNASMEQPFYTDLQRVGWHVGFGTSRGYARILRPARDELALGVRHQRFEASQVARVFGRRTVALLGLGVSSLRLTPDTVGTVLAPLGPVADTGTTLRGRYAPFRATRLGALGGVRNVSFRTVRGFDALKAQQDVATGVMTGLFAAHGLKALGENDMFLSGAAYAGWATDRTLLAALAQVEGRRDMGANLWDSVIGSGRAAYYLTWPGFLFLVEDQYTGGTRSRLPLQLALGDREAGLIAFGRSPLAGAYRNVARAEGRWSAAALVRNADVGMATFTEVGSVWKGDAPYGQTATRASVGLSLMATYPTRTKRLYRVDIGFPVTRGGGLEVRFTSGDFTQSFWKEPDDLARSRTGAVPSSLFAWPTR